MMDKKRIRKTLNDVVERYLLGDVDGDFRFNYIWVRAQLSFAFSIDAITIDEFDALSCKYVVCVNLSISIHTTTQVVTNA